MNAHPQVEELEGLVLPGVVAHLPPHLTWEATVLIGTNTTRHAHGLERLVIEHHLQMAAESRARFEAAHNIYLGDSGFPEDITVTGYQWVALGQNDAFNFGFGRGASRELVNMWVNSPPHLANILNGSFTQVGVGVAKSAAGRTFGVVIFGEPL